MPGIAKIAEFETKLKKVLQYWPINYGFFYSTKKVDKIHLSSC